MKLASLVLVALLGGVAHADEPVPLDPYAGPPPVMPVNNAGQRRPVIRQFLLKHFDRNHDGRLEPRERKMAAKVLHRLANRIAQGGDARQMRRQKFIRRFDLNGDGNIGPGEMPPALADELRPLDRDGDGWLQGNELP